MKVLVTGANGFVGRPLCTLLESRGHAVVRAVREARAPLLEISVNDIGPDTDWQHALTFGVPLQRREECADVVIHLAARVHLLNDASHQPQVESRRINVAGTLHLARQAIAAGVKRFVYLSSIKVNGESTALPRLFRAEDPPAPQDAYAISKWEAEQGLMELAAETGMEVVIIRPPLVYGPGVKANFLAMMRWLAHGVPLPLGAIHNQRSLVALDNLVDLIVTCTTHPAAANQVFLVSDGEDLSTTELLHRTAAAMGKTARLLPVPQKLVGVGLKILGKSDLAQRLCGSLRVDSGKARRLLGWLPPVGVDDGLRKTAQYFWEHQWS
jgi:UDP-glucose 4-epimerase